MFLPDSNYTGSVSESAHSGDQIVRVVAIDKDKSTSVKYRIGSDPLHAVEIKDENYGECFVV